MAVPNMAPTAAAAAASPITLPLGRDSVSYRVTLEPAMIIPAGPLALLLQVTQPSVAAGVAQYSDYEARPWERLVKTLDAMYQLTFASPERSATTARRLRARHAGIKGERSDGVAYGGDDRDLVVWVWATLIGGLVQSHERFVRKLSDDERDRFYEEAKPIAYAFGATESDVPETWAAFESYFSCVIDQQLVPTEVAKNVAGQIRRPPVPFPLNLLAGIPLELLTGGQLPPRLRTELGFAWSPVHQAVFDAATTISRTVNWLVPGPVRRLPMAAAVSAR